MTDIREKVLKWLLEYEKIILFDAGSARGLSIFLSTCNIHLINSHILLVVPQEMTGEGEYELISINNLVYLSQEEYSSLLNLYFTYSFSDRIEACFGEEGSFAGLMNYVKSELLTEGEVFRIMGII